MNQKIKTALFSTIFLTGSAFAVQAMMQEDSVIFPTNGAVSAQAMKQEPRPARRGSKLTKEEKEEAEARKKEFLNKCSRVDTKEPENVVLFKSFDIESREFQNVVSFYQKPRDPADFGKLVEFFASVPQVHKQEAINHLEFHITRQNKGKLGGLKYTPEGMVVDTPTKIKGEVSLRQKLLQPLAEPKAIHLETSDDDF